MKFLVNWLGLIVDWTRFSRAALDATSKTLLLSHDNNNLHIASTAQYLYADVVFVANHS
jgi:hypothetical protein